MRSGEQKSGRHRRRKCRSNHEEALKKWAKDDVSDGDEREQANVGVVVAVAVGLVLVLCLYYIFGQMEYEPPF
jgi:hypothetical protein